MRSPFHYNYLERQTRLTLPWDATAKKMIMERASLVKNCKDSWSCLRRRCRFAADVYIVGGAILLILKLVC